VVKRDLSTESLKFSSRCCFGWRD